jgi:hypothetical protein
MKSKIKLISIGSAILLCLIIFMAYQQIKPIASTEQSETISIAETSLLQDNTVLISYIDAKRLDYLYTKFTDTSKSDDTQPVVIDLVTFIQKLETEGASLVKQFENILLIVNASNPSKNGDNKPKQADLQKILLITGQFEKDKLAEALKTHMLAHKIAKKSHIYRVTPPQNIDTCRQEETFDILIEDDTILITSEGQIKPTLQLLTKSKNPHKNLKDWQDYREGKLFSVAIFNPEQASRSISNRFVHMILNKGENKKELNAFQKAFAGLDINIIGQSIHANLKLWSNKQHVIQTEKSFTAFIDQTKQNFPSEPKEMQTYKSLLDALHSETDGDMWNFDISLDETHIDSLKKLPQNLTAMMFGSLGINNIAIQTEEKEGKALDILAKEENLAPYEKILNIDNLNTAAIDPYNYEGSKVGPFIISANKEPRFPLSRPYKDNLERLYIRVESGIIPNMNIDMHSSKDDQRGEIHIEKVTDDAGQNILEIEACGRDRNDKPSPLETMPHTQYENSVAKSYTRLSSQKILKLAEGRTKEEAQKVQGLIQLRIPSMVQEIILPAKVGETYEDKNVTLTINQATYKDLTYTLTGQKDIILDVRPLNQNKQVIEANSRSSSGDLITQYVEGTPKFVKLIIATQEQTRTYPFKLDIPHKKESEE